MGAAIHGWGEYVSAFALFLVTHVLPARPPIRHRLIAALGKPLYLAIYALVSFAVLAWLIAAAARAPFVLLWDHEPWQRWVPNAAMPVVCLLIGFGAGAPNPLSIGGGRSERFDPGKPGIAGLVRHPLLWAIALWAGAHLVANGDLAHAVLFGSFTVLAFAGMPMIDRRMQRQLGDEQWRHLAQSTSRVPFGSVLTGRLRSWPREGVAWRLSGALLLYAALLLSHEAVIGASPFPVR